MTALVGDDRWSSPGPLTANSTTPCAAATTNGRAPPGSGMVSHMLDDWHLVRSWKPEESWKLVGDGTGGSPNWWEPELVGDDRWSSPGPLTANSTAPCAAATTNGRAPPGSGMVSHMLDD